MASTFLSKLDAKSIRCSLCQSYLSIGPIWIRSSYQPVCGRCEIPSNDNKFRAHFFEKMAKYMFFPCRNDVHGCDLQIPWGAVEAHEKTCKFTPVKCPALNCAAEIARENILVHFDNKHPELVIHEAEFKMPCSMEHENARVNKLFSYQNKNYLVQIGYHQGASRFNIASFEKVDNVFYNLTINGGKGTEELQIRQVAVQTYLTKNHNYATMKKLDYSVLDKLSTSDVICKFTITSGIYANSDPLNEKLLLDLECPVCYQYMKSPIYMCGVGHSICESCKNKISECPSCRTPLSLLRNFTLEKISEHVSYPCKFRQNGCSFHGKLEELCVHEKSCFKSADPVKGNYTCFFNFIEPCSWVGSTEQFIHHLSEIHCSSFVQIGSPLSVEFWRQNQTVLFALYDGEVFRINLWHNNKTGFRIAIQNVSQIKKHKYRFYLRFVKDDGELLVLTKDCCGNILDVSKTLVQPFLKKSRLTFTINIILKL